MNPNTEYQREYLVSIGERPWGKYLVLLNGEDHKVELHDHKMASLFSGFQEKWSGTPPALHHAQRSWAGRAGCGVKEITVNPGQRLSLQRHRKREEHWFIHRGEARVTINDVARVLSVGQYIDIPRECKHRIENIGKEDLVFIEIQTGEYFGEDDIERIEDDHGRNEKE